MKLSIIIFTAITFIATSCKPSLIQHDPFTGTTTVRSQWLDPENGNPAKFLKVCAVYESKRDGTVEYCLDVAVGNPIAMYTPVGHYPQILEKNSLQLLVDNVVMTYSTKQADIKRYLADGFLFGWQIEQARYRGMSKADLLAIARAKEVKLQVLCQTLQPQTTTLTKRTQQEIGIFLTKKLISKEEAQAQQ